MFLVFLDNFAGKIVGVKKYKKQDTRMQTNFKTQNSNTKRV